MFMDRKQPSSFLICSMISMLILELVYSVNNVPYEQH